MSTHPPTITAYQCESCLEVSGADALDRLYHCDNCDTYGVGVDNRRCYECNRFMAREDDLGCPVCLSSGCEEIEAVFFDGQYMSPQEYERYVTTGDLKAVRKELLARHAEEMQTKRRAKEQEMLEGTVEVLASEARVGQQLYANDNGPWFDFGIISEISDTPPSPYQRYSERSLDGLVWMALENFAGMKDFKPDQKVRVRP